RLYRAHAYSPDGGAFTCDAISWQTVYYNLWRHQVQSVRSGDVTWQIEHLQGVVAHDFSLGMRTEIEIVHFLDGALGVDHPPVRAEHELVLPERVGEMHGRSAPVLGRIGVAGHVDILVLGRDRDHFFSPRVAQMNADDGQFREVDGDAVKRHRLGNGRQTIVRAIDEAVPHLHHDRNAQLSAARVIWVVDRSIRCLAKPVRIKMR